MRTRRRRNGFERVGHTAAGELGLPRKRARELVLLAAWREVAGEALARRARPSAVTRGVLELAVEDERWIDTLRGLIPRLAGRLAARHPELGVRRFRVRRAGVGRAELTGDLVLDGTELPPAADPPPVDASSQPMVEEGSPVERLERVIARYLRRSSRW